MPIYILSYEIYPPHYGLKDEDYGIKTPVPIRFENNKQIEAANGTVAEALLKEELKRRFGKDNEIVILSCESQAMHELIARAKKTLFSKT